MTKRARGAAGMVIASWTPLLMQFVAARVADPALTPLLVGLLLVLVGTGWAMVWRNAEHPGLQGSDVVTLGLSKSSEERS